MNINQLLGWSRISISWRLQVLPGSRPGQGCGSLNGCLRFIDCSAILFGLVVGLSVLRSTLDVQHVNTFVYICNIVIDNWLYNSWFYGQHVWTNIMNSSRIRTYSRWTKYSNPAARIMLNPAPPNLNVSARVLPKVMLGVWFFSSIGANALQVTLTLNFGGEGVVPDRRGLNISSIYRMNG